MQAFLSYTHFDDQHNKQFITKFRKNLSDEVRSQTGTEFLIFQDVDIGWGQNWRMRLEQALNEAALLIPIITPSFFTSDPCKEELQRFLKREEERHRNDLILPLYFIETPSLSDPENKLANAITSHQYADWRQLRFEQFSSSPVRKALAELASQIKKTMERTTALTENAAEQVKIRFTQSINECGDHLVCEIMRPRNEMVMIEAKKSVAEARRLMVESKYSCIPVYLDQIDNIEGLVYAVDLLAYSERKKEKLSIIECVRPALFIPDSMSIARVFESYMELLENKIQMAIVVDKYGWVTGLVTFEDIINSLFVSKESRDECDEAE